MEKIAKKMTLVMRDVASAPQTGKHHHNYKYHTREDAFVVRAKMIEHGIAHTTRTRILSVESAGKSTILNVEVECDFICTESGQKITASAVGQGADTQDQAASKAQTNAIKNLFLNTFLLGTESDYPTKSAQPAGPPPIDPVDHKKAIQHLENVLIGNMGIAPPDALLYIEKHIPGKVGCQSIDEVQPQVIENFAEKINNSLTNSPDKVIETISGRIEKLKAS